MRIRAIVLAAGKGTRMKSARPKVLHELCGRPMLWYMLASLRRAGIRDVLVVTSDELERHISTFGVRSVVQSDQLGTGHAVKIALDAMDRLDDGLIVVAYADMPLIPEEIFRGMVDSLEDGNAPAAMAMVTVKMPLPSNFGRVVRSGENVERIVEVRDATAAELAIDEMNAGIYACAEPELREAVAALRNDNAQREYYLTDTIEYLAAKGRRVRPVTCDASTTVSNSRVRVKR
jgi:bifunctional UDP-N-acetylglucosamine pyrophosphorylase / glucosamine-1-phosphate N-acetyltransferase